MPFFLLGAALVAFLASTRQWAFMTRLIVWGVGVLLLVAALVTARTEEGFMGILLGDAAHHWQKPGDSILALLVGNWRSVSGAVPSMLNVAAALTGALAVAALVAMSPGVTVERIIRPINIGLIGAVFGAFAALAMVAGGFAGYQKDRVYVGQVSSADVIDGDTIRFGDVSVRLYGVDAPEFHGDETAPPGAANQVCLQQGATFVKCGQLARARLQTLVQGKLVACRPPQDHAAGAAPQETFGRPIVICSLENPAGAPIEINRQLVEDGYVAAYRDASNAQVGDYREAAAYQFGCTLRPGIWRRDEAKRAAFLERRLSSITDEDLVGKCPRLPAPAR